MIEKSYEHIYIIQVDQKPKTFVFDVRNKRSGAYLGSIAWYGAWRQYCFFPAEETIFSKSCMLDIIDFVDGLEVS